LSDGLPHLRAGIVDHLGHYLFSNYNFYAKGKPDSLITASPVYLGMSDSVSARQKNYVDFVVDESIINSRVIENKLYIGSQSFIDRYQQSYGIKNRREVRGRPPKAEK